MPIYEFRCPRCGTEVSVFTRRIGEPVASECPQCGRTDLVRLVSRFSHQKSTSQWHRDAGPPQAMGDADYYKDPRNIGRWTEHRLKQLGMDMRSEEYRNTFSEVREMIDAAREGEMPKSLEDL